MPEYDLDQIAKDFRAANAAIDPGDNEILALHLRGSEAELALLLWFYGEANAGRVTGCDMSKAFGGLVGGVLYNYLLSFSENERDHQLKHFFDCLGDTLSAPSIVGKVEIVPITNKSDLH